MSEIRKFKSVQFFLATAGFGVHQMCENDGALSPQGIFYNN